MTKVLSAVPATDLLDQLRLRSRQLGRSARTERAYVYWTRHFICQHRQHAATALKLRDMENFITGLEYHWRVSKSSRQQALSALRFFYREVLDLPLPGTRSGKAPPRIHPQPTHH